MILHDSEKTPVLGEVGEENVISKSVTDFSDLPSRLTPREFEILKVSSQGYSEKQIAVMLGVEKHTIHKHMHRAQIKFGLNRIQLIAMFAAWQATTKPFDFLNMPAGEEIDILVARKVFGHVVQQDSSGQWFEGFTLIARYSDSLQSAWNAAERLISTKDAFYTVRRKGKQWMAEFEIKKVKNFAFADTAPLAICRAALLAISNIAQ